jgi:hypothetical protein
MIVESGMGHERRFRDIRGESGLPPTPERLRQRGELALRANNGSLQAKFIELDNGGL